MITSLNICCSLLVADVFFGWRREGERMVPGAVIDRWMSHEAMSAVVP